MILKLEYFISFIQTWTKLYPTVGFVCLSRGAPASYTCNTFHINILLEYCVHTMETTIYLLISKYASLTCVGISKGADLSIAVAVDVSPLR